jgi:uncharacterized protein (UPF0335 family)
MVSLADIAPSDDADEDDLARILAHAKGLGLDVERVEELYRRRYGDEEPPSMTWQSIPGFISKRADPRYGQTRTDEIDTAGDRARRVESGVGNRFIDMSSQELAAELHETLHKIRRARTDKGRTKAFQRLWRLLNELWGPVDDDSVIHRDLPGGGTISSVEQQRRDYLFRGDGDSHLVERHEDTGLRHLLRAASYHLVEDYGWTTLDEKGRPVNRLRPVRHHASEKVRVAAVQQYVALKASGLSGRECERRVGATHEVKRTTIRRWAKEVDHFAKEQHQALLVRGKSPEGQKMQTTDAPKMVERVARLEVEWATMKSELAEHARQLGITHDDEGVSAAVDDFLESALYTRQGRKSQNN